MSNPTKATPKKRQNKNKKAEPIKEEKIQRNFNINGKDFVLLGEITTPQQFDFAKGALYQFVKQYKQSLLDGVDSVFLTFKDSKQMIGFLSVILVPKGLEMWSVKDSQEIQAFFEKKLPDFEILEEVVSSFFALNHKWLGFSPILRGVKQQMMNMIMKATLEELPSLKNISSEINSHLADS